MKTTRNLIVLTFASMVMTSCFFGNDSEEMYYDDYEMENEYAMEDQNEFDTAFAESSQNKQNFNNQFQTNASRSAVGNRLEMKPIKDSESGQVMMHSPFPKSWKINPNPKAAIQVQAPNNVRIKKTETHQFAYAQDAFAQESIRKMGSQVAAPLSLDQILQQQIVPSAQSQGYQLTKKYDMPNYRNKLNVFMGQMFGMGSAVQISVMGTEWEHNNGQKSFIILTRNYRTDGKFVLWQLHTTEMEAPASAFEQGKQTWIYALENTQINQQWLQATNQKLMVQKQQTDAKNRQMMQQSQMAHQQRMANIRAQGQAALNTGKIYSDILDSSHSSYMGRSAVSSAGQSAYVNSVWERQTMTDNSGNRYQVDGYDNNVWMNQNNQYIGTDNTNYNPNIDNAVNNQVWEQLQSADDWNN